ncbi:hypothetical protein MHBO_001612, partial [Bonamia ostreae]
KSSEKTVDKNIIFVNYNEFHKECDFQYEPLVKERLRHWASFERGSENLWAFKGNKDVLNRSFVETVSSPDDACVIESMRIAEQRLHDLGITDLYSISFETLKRINNGTNDSLKQIAKFIARELKDTPWHKTSVFNQARMRRCFLQTRNPNGTLINGDFGFKLKRERSRKNNSEKCLKLIFSVG